ncbi:TIGR04206 family protein [Halobacteriales archaeon QS_1_68_20]|nr:MAG: TIGR04206 family protein [Halobacteriales archaeon QS_1_68_20]
MAATPSRGRLLAMAALAGIPWTVVPSPGTLVLVFPWGLASVDPLVVTWLPEYLRLAGPVPRLLEGWPVAGGLYTLALASAAAGAFTVEDERVTGGLLVLAGASNLLVSLWLFRGGRVGLPVGTLLLWTAAWWFHAGDLRRALQPET